ncbi:Npun_F0494 family protein [Prochlorococcus sp. MIT 1307]|uniref:Npun_F0494 family protein n=1 Tax=Prochlorococcus sp. MIT 1307 TaxID=3096219 RepID=UPI002A751925|nr:Npun_F0494 family protein [Prochlorococcus sp. MIT 1307]
MELIDNLIIKRTNKAFRCLPLNSKFYKEVQKHGLNAENVFLQRNKYQVNGSKWFKHSSSVESAFRWLITIGILRREVDGQGLTSSIRLTPLGRQVLEQTPDLPNQKADFLEQISNYLHRQWPLR